MQDDRPEAPRRPPGSARPGPRAGASGHPRQETPGQARGGARPGQISGPGPTEMTPERRPRTRIQRRNVDAILRAALDVFAAHGFRGATLDQIAAAAGLSKPNLLYYFPSKEAVH